MNPFQWKYLQRESRLNLLIRHRANRTDINFVIQYKQVLQIAQPYDEAVVGGIRMV